MTDGERPVAVVTGAGRGIGREIALALSGQFDLALSWHEDESAAKQTAMLATDRGARVELVQGDVALTASADALVATALALGGLSVWINNAGISHLGPLLDTPACEARRMVEVNYLGTFHGLVAAARAMGPLGGGRIVNVASDLGIRAAPLLAAYSATKFAVVGLTQAAAIELAPLRIAVNAVCPGTVETDMVLAEEAAEAALGGEVLEAVRARLQAAVPAGRLCRAEDVAALCLFLATQPDPFLTGQSICVNGGSILH